MRYVSVKKESKFLVPVLLALAASGCFEGHVDDVEQPAAIVVEEKVQPDAGLIEEEIIPLGLTFRNMGEGTYLKGGTVYPITWYIKTDPGFTEFDPGFYVSKLEISKDSGQSWIVPTGADAIPGKSDQSIVYKWSIPDATQAGWSGETFKARVTVTNIRGNWHRLNSPVFVIDNTPPTIVPGTLSINSRLDSPISIKSPVAQVGFQAQDTLSPISDVCFKVNSSSAPPSDDPCWQPLASLGLFEKKAVTIEKLPYPMGFVSGVFNFNVWAKDKAGNLSALGNGGSGDSGVDLRVVNYVPGNAVTFNRIYAANTDAPARPPGHSEVNVDGVTNTQFYIKWGFTLLDGASLAAANPLRLEYTTDELNYTLITDSISDAANGSCTFAAPETGCFVWTPPAYLASQHLRIRLTVVDDGNFSYSTTTQSLNTGKFRVVAGNTNANLGGNGSYAVFNTETQSQGQLAVAEDGRIFIEDTNQGVLMMSPDDGKVQVYVKLDTVSNDGFIEPPATLEPGEVVEDVIGTTSSMLKISLDYQGNLLIMERYRIRKVARRADPMGRQRLYIDTLIGGGTNATRDTAPLAQGIPARQFSMSVHPNAGGTWSMFTPLPNGDIYFTQSELSVPAPDYDIRIYKANKNKVYAIKLQGAGVVTNCPGLSAVKSCVSEPYREIASDLKAYGLPGISFNAKTSFVNHLVVRFNTYLGLGNYQWFGGAFNPRTGVGNGTGTQIQYVSASWWAANQFASRNGALYSFWNAALYKYNTGSTKWERVLGASNGAMGQCADGTQALACNTDIQDVYINASNVIFFLDRGRIRTVARDGSVVTIAGQTRSSGDGGDPLMARFGEIYYTGRWGGDDKLVMADVREYVVRELVQGSTVSAIAGNRGNGIHTGWSNGHEASDRTALESSLYLSWEGANPFALDPETGEAYFTDWATSVSGILRLNRSGEHAGRFTRVVGGGTNNLFTNAGTGCEGMTGDQCRGNLNWPLQVMGIAPSHETPEGVTLPSQVIFSSSHYNPQLETHTSHCFIKSLFPASGKIGHFVGNDLECSRGSSFPVEGATMSYSNKFPGGYPVYMMRPLYYPERDSWLMAKVGEKRIVQILNNRDSGTNLVVGAGTLTDLVANIGSSIESFNLVRNASTNETEVVYCSGGSLIFYNLTTRGTTYAALPAGIRCAGRTIEVSSDGQRVIFPFTQKGIWGIGDYYIGL